MTIRIVKEFDLSDSFYWINHWYESTRFSVRSFPTRKMICLQREYCGVIHDKHPLDMKISIKELRSLIQDGTVVHNSKL